MVFGLPAGVAADGGQQPGLASDVEEQAQAILDKDSAAQAENLRCASGACTTRCRAGAPLRLPHGTCPDAYMHLIASCKI